MSQRTEDLEAGAFSMKSPVQGEGGRVISREQEERGRVISRMEVSCSGPGEGKLSSADKRVC